MTTIIKQNVTNLRKWLKQNQLDAFIIPHEDEYLSEYLPAHNERLKWISGFSGSAGVAIVTVQNAAIFVDGRYTVQVTKQTPNVCFEYHHLIEDPFLEWIKSQLPSGTKIGFDPKMHRATWFKLAQKTLLHDRILVPVTKNPIDSLWQNRPSLQRSKMTLMPDAISGKTSLEKRQHVAQILMEKKADSAIITQLDSICWLLNIRGLDVPRLPVILSHAIIDDSGNVDFFITEDRLAENFLTHVGSGVTICSPNHLENKIALLSKKQVLLDTTSSNAWFKLKLQECNANIIATDDPCTLLKATKNISEIAGMKNCHIRDGVAMTKYLCWLDQQVAQNTPLNEAILSDKLEIFRREDPTLVDLSFDTISAVGSNAAMCHYNHMNQQTPGKLSLNSLYLVDSGAHYQNGTTDITRTVAIGTPSDKEKRLFTLVLKGHIALASIRFPQGTSGHQLDVLARQFLWSQGYDFDHGTGHGVGHCLSVHEGPQRISKAPNNISLLPGMVISNEPGYYEEDQFGIRIENLELVTPVTTNGNKDMLGFSSLTRCPIDIRAIDRSLLNIQEIQWVNEYHQLVWQDIAPLVDGEVKEWLKQATSKM